MPRPRFTASSVQAMSSAMASVVTEWGTRLPTPIERECVAAIGQYVLDSDVDLEACDCVPSSALAAALPDPAERLFALRLCMILCMVGDTLRREQVALLERLAAILETPAAAELGALHLALARRYKWLLLQVTRRAASDYWAKGGRPGIRDWIEVAEQGFFAGRIARPRIASKYQALGGKPAGTLGREIHDFYASHDYRLPGEKGGMPEQFILHECTHILSGYDTDPVGEMLVTVFTAGGKKRNVMDWVFVSLLQWHLGASVGSFTIDCSHRGLLQPGAFFHAWIRGMDMHLSLMDDPWSWWDVIDVPVEALRERYGIAPMAFAYERTAASAH